jgi:hypothetical protein
MVSERTQQIRTALAIVIGAALVDRVFLHLLNVTPAALIASVLIAVTLAAGLRSGNVIKLALMWWLWTAICLADLLALHLLQASGLQCFLAFMLSGGLVEAASRQLSARQGPGAPSTALVLASDDCAVAVPGRHALRRSDASASEYGEAA